jgi:TP901 family phage tail tape measure protein
LAGTTTQTQLKLVISAQDDAKAVFEAFATNLAEQMTKIKESMSEGFNMEGLVSKVNAACSQMTEAFDKVKVAEGELGSGNAASKLDEQMGAMARSVSNMSEAVTKGFKNVEEQAAKMNQSLSHASSGIDYSEMMNAGMIMSQYGEKVIGFIGESMKAGAEFDQSIKNATASLNANLQTTKLSTDQIDAMSRSALKMGSDGFFSANQIAEAMNTMARQGMTYQTIMSGGIDVVKNVAAANQQDLEETANVVSDIFNEMQGEFSKAGLSTQQASQQIGNSMTVALHSARLSMADFLQTMKYVGPQASAVGMSIQDVSTAIAILGEHGIKGSQAGTTLRRMLTNLTPTTKAQVGMMEKLGMVTKDGGNIFYTSSGQMKSFSDIQQILHDKLSGLSPEMQQLAIKTIFGQYALSGMTAIVGESGDKIAQLTGLMANNNLMSDIMKEKQQGLVMQQQALKAHWETLQKEIGLMLAPVLTKLITILNGVMDKFNNLSPGLQKAIVYFAAITGAVLTVGGAIFTFIGTMGMLASSFAKVMTSLSEVGLGFSEVVPFIGILVGVIGGLKYAWDKDIGGIREITSRFTDWFKGIFNNTLGQAVQDVHNGLHKLTEGFSGWNRSIMGPVNRAMAGIFLGISDAMKKITTVVSQGILAVTGWFNKMAPDFNKAITQIVKLLVWLTPLWKASWTVIKVVVGLVFDWIKGIIQEFWGVFSGVIQLITHLINGQWKKVFQDLWQIVKNAFLLVLDLWGGAATKGIGFFMKILDHTGIFGKVFKTLLTTAFKFVEPLIKTTWKIAEGVFKGSIMVIEGFVSGFSKMIQLIFKAIKSFIEDHATGAMKILKTVWDAGFKIAKTLAETWWHGVVDIFKAIKALFSGEPNKAMKFLLDAFKTGFNAAKSILTTWWSAVSKIFNTVVSFIRDYASQAMDFLKKHFEAGVNYVKNLLDKWGTNVKNLFTKVKTSITDAVTKAMDFFKSKFDVEIQYVKNLLRVFQTIVLSIWSGIKDLIHGHSSQAMSLFKQAFQIGVNTVQTILRGLWNIVDSILGGLPSKFLNWGKKAISSISDALKSGYGIVASDIGGILSRIDSALGGLPSKMLNWGKNAMSMFVQGIQSGIGAIGDAVSSVAGKIKDFLGFHSPTKLGPMSESDVFMPNMMKMFEKGIIDNKDKIMKATLGVAVGVKQSLSTTQEQIHSFVGNGNNTATQSITNHHAHHRPLIVNINVEGRSRQTDKQLAEDIAKQFRTQMSMVMG